LPGGRKNTHAVTAKPRALARAVRRTTASRAKSARTDVQPPGFTSSLSSKGERNTSTIKTTDTARVSQNNSQGSRERQRKSAMQTARKKELPSRYAQPVRLGSLTYRRSGFPA